LATGCYITVRIPFNPALQLTFSRTAINNSCDPLIPLFIYKFPRFDLLTDARHFRRVFAHSFAPSSLCCVSHRPVYRQLLASTLHQSHFFNWRPNPPALHSSRFLLVLCESSLTLSTLDHPRQPPSSSPSSRHFSPKLRHRFPFTPARRPRRCVNRLLEQVCRLSRPQWKSFHQGPVKKLPLAILLLLGNLTSLTALPS